MNSTQILAMLHSLSNPRAKEALSYFKIESKNVIGISAPILKTLAKKIGKNHKLAQELWATNVLEARAIAVLIEEPHKVSEKQTESWLKDFDSWAIVDTACCYLFRLLPNAYEKVSEWTSREKEYEKRAGFSLMAYLAVHDKKESDAKFELFFPHIVRESTDERNFVKKAVNWALRQIGKRNVHLNTIAIRVAKEIHKRDSRSAKWIASDALRELQSEAIQKRLKK
ncbi:MAG: DNA alkylation repair protein [Ignavibacteria bacterium]|nr:DNA alkylation repair protein [Ignavibacteria bacterium]